MSAPTNRCTNMYFSVFSTRSSICDIHHIPKVVWREKVVISFHCAHNGLIVEWFLKIDAKRWIKKPWNYIIFTLHCSCTVSISMQGSVRFSQSSTQIRKIHHRGTKGASSYLWTLLTFISCKEQPLENVVFKPLQLKCLYMLFCCLFCTEMSRKVASGSQKSQHQAK